MKAVEHFLCNINMSEAGIKNTNVLLIWFVQGKENKFWKHWLVFAYDLYIWGEMLNSVKLFFYWVLIYFKFLMQIQHFYVQYFIGMWLSTMLNHITMYQKNLYQNYFLSICFRERNFYLQFVQLIVLSVKNFFFFFFLELSDCFLLGLYTNVWLRELL